MLQLQLLHQNLRFQLCELLRGMGQHWHNSKWELFIVVACHGLIQEKYINTGEMVEFEVSGEKIEEVHMIPGWTHNPKEVADVTCKLVVRV